MTTDALKTARQQVEELEKQMLDDVTTKAALLGLTLTKGDGPAAPKQRRKRRTKAEIQAAGQERVE